MNYRQFGSTSMKVSEIGMGCWAIGGNQFGNSYGSTDDAISIKTIKRAVELGCNFFDTADVYGHGHSEELLGLALNKVREKVFIATKVGGAYMYGENFGHINFTENYIRFALDKSLLRLKTDYIDLYQLHNPPLNMIREGKIFGALKELKKEGKIKFAGVSVHTLDEGVAALKHVDSIQCVFNMLDPRNYELIEGARSRGVGLIAREPLCNGFLSGKFKGGEIFEKGDIRSGMPPAYTADLIEKVNQLKEMFSKRPEPFSQIALKYVLSFNGVSVTIPGAKTPEQAEQNLKASEIQDLTEEELKSLGS